MRLIVGGAINRVTYPRWLEKAHIDTGEIQMTTVTIYQITPGYTACKTRAERLTAAAAWVHWESSNPTIISLTPTAEPDRANMSRIHQSLSWTTLNQLTSIYTLRTSWRSRRTNTDSRCVWSPYSWQLSNAPFTIFPFRNNEPMLLCIRPASNLLLRYDACISLKQVCRMSVREALWTCWGTSEPVKLW